MLRDPRELAKELIEKDLRKSFLPTAQDKKNLSWDKDKGVGFFNVTDPWYEDVTLFTADYFDITAVGVTNEDIPEDQTVVVNASVDSYGNFTKEIMYFQRGLNVSLMSGFFWIYSQTYTRQVYIIKC